MENKITNTANERKKKIFFRVAIVLSLIISFVCGYFFNTCTQGKQRRNLNAVLDLIEEKGVYVTVNPDGSELSDDQLLELIVKTLLENDKYARYYSKEEYRAQQLQNQGFYSGFGLEFVRSNAVYSVVGNSPAENAGIRANDVIEKLQADNNQEVVISDFDSLNAFLEANENCKTLKITVTRNGEEKTFTLTKQEFTVSYVKYFDNEKSINLISNGKKIITSNYISETNYNLPSDTALIKLNEFMGDADVQFGGAIDYMKERGKTKLILDLRGNGGGRLDVLSKIAGYLIYNGGKSSSEIVYSQGKSKSETFYTTFNKYNIQIKKTVVLADKNTASASECLIGAMLYYGKQEIDGNFTAENLVISKDLLGNATTYGKGIMQTTYQLYSGEAIKFTTAKIYQPDRTTCIQDVGITTVSDNQVDDVNALTRAIQITALD